MSERLPVRTANLLDPEEAYGMVRAALDGGVVLVPLDRAPRRAGQHVIHLQAPGLREPILVIAEPAGEPTAGMFPLRLRVKDAEHARQLAALIDAPPPSEPAAEEAPRRERASFRMDVPAAGGQRPTLDSLDGPFDEVVRIGSLTTLDTPLDVASEDPDRSSRRMRAALPEDLSGHTLADGKYEIVELIGRGGAGKVYRARHVGLDRELAVKVLHRGRDADARVEKRFQREARVLARLDHPNVVRVIDVGRERDGRLYIVTELLEGTPLNRIVADRAPFPLKHVVGLMEQVCAGLGAAHEQGIVHRDVKPENVIAVPWQDDSGRDRLRLKVCDFGTARLLEPEAGRSSSANLTGTGLLCGTPEFMAPEQVLSEDPDASTDVYSCGIMLFELATGRLPFRSKSVVALLNSQLYDPPPKPSKVAAVDLRLERVILRAMSKKRESRHGNARELRADLLELLR